MRLRRTTGRLALPVIVPSVAGLVLLGVPLAAPAVAAAPECDPDTGVCLATFAYTGGVQSFTVPAGVTELVAVTLGGSGGNGLDEGDVTPLGGVSGATAAGVAVTPGETLSIVVGGRGGDAVFGTDPTPPASKGGYGGGGDGTAAVDGPVGAGGGGSFVFDGKGAPLVVAGGGGGAGYTGDAATADGGDGGSGGAGSAGAPAASGGGGATATAGGAAGGGTNASPGTGPATGPSAFGVGGSATETCSSGGGGGGYFGGGSGGCVGRDIPTAQARAAKAGKAVAATADAPAADAAPSAVGVITSAGGGGGGSGYVAPGGTPVDVGNPPSSLEGNDGIVVLGYTSVPTTTTLTAASTLLAPGQETTLQATVTGGPVDLGATGLGGSGDDGGAAQAALAAPRVDGSAVARAAVAKAFGSGTAARAAAAPAAAPIPADPTAVVPGTACSPDPCTVTFLVNGQPLSDPIPLTAAGTASVTFTAGSQLGPRQITARYDGSLIFLQSVSAPVTITVNGLANTGTDEIAPMLLTATGLLAAGAGLLAFGRRRPTTGRHRTV